MAEPTISLCAAAMNRNTFIEESLVTWVKLPFREIIIVDWSSKNPLHRYIFDMFNDSRIKIIRVDGESLYNQSKASNLKVRVSSSEYVLSIDSDIKLSETFITNHPLSNDVFYIGNKAVNKGLVGTCLVSRNTFFSVNGYNEFMNGWGYHDNDFYKRLVEIGFCKKYLGENDAVHIDHGNGLRIRNYEQKSIKASDDDNKVIARETPWGIDNKMEVKQVSIYLTNGKIEKTSI